MDDTQDENWKRFCNSALDIHSLMTQTLNQIIASLERWSLSRDRDTPQGKRKMSVHQNEQKKGEETLTEQHVKTYCRHSIKVAGIRACPAAVTCFARFPRSGPVPSGRLLQQLRDHTTAPARLQ